MTLRMPEKPVETTLDADGWSALDLDARANAAVRAVLSHLGHDPAGFEISLLGCDDARIADLNAEFRGKPAPTNVLSWPSDERAADVPGGAPQPPQGLFPDEPIELGDVAIALETCLREAEAVGRSADDHVTHLLVHGILHLLGYDHETDADAALMEGLETTILAKLGIADPYAEQGGFPDQNG